MIRRAYPAALIAGPVGLCGLVFLLVAGGLLGGVAQSAATCSAGPTPSGAGEIPARLVPLYRAAAAAYGLGADGWAWLAAVNRIETDFGRNLATSSAGAVGWMQVEPGTWAQYGDDGDGDGRRDPSQPADAIPAAANYLRSLGAPADWQAAIRGYNGGPGNAHSASTLGYWQSTIRSATTYLNTSSPPAAAACTPCPPADPAQPPDTLVGYDPAAVPDARGGEGFTPAPGTVYTLGQEPQIARRLEQLGRALHLRLTGVSGYRSPSHSLAVGGSRADPHTRGEASDTPGIEEVPEATLEQFGLTRPFDRLLPGGGHADRAEADHVQLLRSVAPTVAPTTPACADAGAVPLAPGDRAQILADGRAAAPAAAPPQVRAMLAAVNELIGRPYVYGGGHAGWMLATGYDCSSSVSWALHGAGFLPAPEDSVTLEGFGEPGAGLWVTVYANPVHAFIYVAGLLDTSPQSGDGPRRQLGPRWRPADRSTAGFVARHPPGL